MNTIMTIVLANVTTLCRYSQCRIRRSTIAPQLPNSSCRLSSSTTEPPPLLNANVIQGPSILKTSVPRSSPSLLFLPGLRQLPFWTSYDPSSDTNRIAYQDPTLTKVVALLEKHVSIIRQEYHRVAPLLQSDYKHDAANEHSLHRGTWDWHSYMTKGKIQGQFGQYFTETTQILQLLRQHDNDPTSSSPSWLLLENMPFGYAFFSTLHPHSTIKAHVSPMNLRWRIHLPLEVPPNATQLDDRKQKLPLCGIRVGNQVQTWTEGKALVLDDSYDHEVWNNTDHRRVLLLIDIWHPDIAIKERIDIVGMFQHAQEQGWYK
jgi:Aspartyl/Asparaginyl beta-hydroxylase